MMNDTHIVISVQGGVVNGVCSNNANVKTYLVDFDDLEQEPDADCSEEFLVGSLADFFSAVKAEVGAHPGLAKLVAHLKE